MTRRSLHAIADAHLRLAIGLLRAQGHRLTPAAIEGLLRLFTLAVGEAAEEDVYRPDFLVDDDEPTNPGWKSKRGGKA